MQQTEIIHATLEKDYLRFIAAEFVNKWNKRALTIKSANNDQWESRIHGINIIYSSNAKLINMLQLSNKQEGWQP